jgi:hypothetical protein
MKDIGDVQPLMSVLKDLKNNYIDEPTIKEWLKYQLKFNYIGDSPLETLENIQIYNRALTKLLDKCIMELKMDIVKPKLTEDKNDWFDKSQVRKIYGVSKTTINDWVNNGKFPDHRKVSERKTLIPLQNIIDFNKHNPKYKRIWEAQMLK